MRLFEILKSSADRSRLMLTPDGGVVVGPELPEAIARLVEGFDPLRIILFGSYARGDAQPDSDLDLLVVARHRATC